MDGTQKPFACKSAGCNMRFTNEDHLTVHTKKHAMSLHLGLDSKAASFVGKSQTIRAMVPPCVTHTSPNPTS